MMAAPLVDPRDQSLVRDTSSCVTRVIAGETLIVPIAGGVADLEAIYTLNDVGSRIWSLLEQPMTLRRIADRIQAEFEVSSDVAARDVAEFVETLRGAGLVRAAGGPDGNA
jgi:coenzyme PQQ synthesis protein D (PqqD)